MSHVKLFIPGPVEVSEKTYQALRSPVMGHRSKDFQDLFRRVQPGLQELFFTRRPVFVSTSSAWGVMEGAVRNLVAKKVLSCMNGAFSDKWHDVALRCGKKADKLQVEWGKIITPKALDAALKTGGYDAVTIIHNETSTGAMNPLPELAEVMKKYPDVMFIVDVVSSFSALKIPFDELGIDVMLAGVQKALALPPGAAVFAVSEKALARAETMNDRGYYFDFIEFEKNAAKNMTPSTPSISHIYALKSKLEDIFSEGLEKRYARHLRNAEITREWVKKNGFEFFAQKGHESVTLTCVRNNRGVDVPKLIQWLRENHDCIIDGGYGKIKGESFRISHMGDESTENIQELLNNLSEGLSAIG